jgi:putative chitinase
VKAAFGSAPGWQLKAFDNIYGGRMGNRPGTSDGSRYIGRGGPQITGRDGYEQVGRRCHLDLVNQPELATLPECQPAILAAFYEWKGLSDFADRGDFDGFVKAWNGGTIGLEDRKERLKGNNSVINRLRTVARTFSVMDALKAILAGAPQPVP